MKHTKITILLSVALGLGFANSVFAQDRMVEDEVVNQGYVEAADSSMEALADLVTEEDAPEQLLPVGSTVAEDAGSMTIALARADGSAPVKLVQKFNKKNMTTNDYFTGSCNYDTVIHYMNGAAADNAQVKELQNNYNLPLFFVHYSYSSSQGKYLHNSTFQNDPRYAAYQGMLNNFKTSPERGEVGQLADLIRYVWSLDLSYTQQGNKTDFIPFLEVMNKQTNCAGITTLTYDLLNKTNLKHRVVYFNDKSVCATPHVTNEVFVNGKWQTLDLMGPKVSIDQNVGKGYVFTDGGNMVDYFLKTSRLPYSNLTIYTSRVIQSGVISETEVAGSYLLNAN